MINFTWTLEMLLSNWWALKSKWIYHYKRKPDDSILQHKTQWVVKEFEQQFRINYKEIFATVVKFMTYKVIFIIAVFYNYKLKQMNIKMTFLHDDLKEEVYVVQLTEYEEEKDKMCKLKKVLYELK